MGNSAACCVGNCENGGNSYFFEMEPSEPPKKGIMRRNNTALARSMNEQSFASMSHHGAALADSRSTAYDGMPLSEASLPTSVMIHSADHYYGGSRLGDSQSMYIDLANSRGDPLRSEQDFHIVERTRSKSDNQIETVVPPKKTPPEPQLSKAPAKMSIIEEAVEEDQLLEQIGKADFKVNGSRVKSLGLQHQSLEQSKSNSDGSNALHVSQ